MNDLINSIIITIDYLDVVGKVESIHSQLKEIDNMLESDLCLETIIDSIEDRW